MTGDRKAAGDSLRGLALGDGFGVRWFHQGDGQRAIDMIRERRTPTEAPFSYTDDTAMAIPILRVLFTTGQISEQHLAEMFGATYEADPYRGYGYGMTQLLPKLSSDSGNWATHARSLFGGEGSLGNGAAMRVAPLGAWFHRDLDRVVDQATRSAHITHLHPEGIAGAIGVALAAALSAAGRSAPPIAGADMLRRVAELTPSGLIREGILQASELGLDTPPWRVADLLGNGQRIRASDTVPFALWCAARHPDSVEDALWATAEGLGDVDTTCAIVGGIVGARVGIRAAPSAWLELREPLPTWAEDL
ncbi:MAG TPA: ADP-ribosylglycohydrolase family protein [Actinospica sp.]|nr:ADP-ribosylglycohydrolase family protein [Actinospica sp.]